MRGMHRPHVRPMRHMPRARPMMRPLAGPYRGWWPFMPGLTCLPGLLFGLFMVGLALFWLLVSAIL